ncbi:MULTISPECIES: branched-chain amino acid ABC transporter permease [Burkholderiaceae]|uniref:Amino acid/amide ABC transporter membrane protein 1, HAAT family n=6 Tax=Burkholderiaceae TaxID=119060 RepID=A0A1M6YWK4_9BURK|nr:MULTISPECIES: branched-chain amino acid ABC transporter permease [Burkholderiaceae]CDS81816.1 Inner-membrane translocator [Burkholderia sp. TGCL-27]CDS91067.1 Inner-membrane translocator [Ralstonia sp. TGCL-16]CDS91164.1 Inner-membrane translocator [Cupriavidus sp. TGCL-26]AAR31060.1 putative ABC transporter permease protein [Cupriavidus pinatubonensis JMP134]CAG9187014.1 High-affinity branched-chain amino acid transport system permease protein LivH [Cupriavidus pampae]
MFQSILVQALSGVSSGMVLFLVASGMTLIFGTLRVANFAHGSFYMIAAYLSFTLTRWVGHGTWGFVVSLVVAPLIVALLGLVVERFLLRRIATRAHQYQLILTYALTLILADAVKMIWGRDNFTVPRPGALDGAFDIFGTPFPSYYALLIVVGAVIAVALHLLLTRTRFGKVLRASVADGQMVGALGIDVPRLYTGVFALGAWLAGLGGALAAPVGSISLGIDSSIIIECFAVVIIGGVGSVGGALLGALIIGVTKSVGILFAPKLAIAFIFIALCAVLVLRPQGLLGRSTA